MLHPQKSGAAVLVAVERKSRFVLLAKQAGKHAAPVAAKLNEWFSVLPLKLRRTLTQDTGTEFAMHYQLNALGMATYFCAPHHPWQKGSVENMNGRIRRYIPLGTEPNSFSDADMQVLANQLNHTPRKCLGFKTPAEVFLAHLKPLHLVCVSNFPLSRE
ncbi:Integrase core domain protein [Clostridium vincentii]|uniref:Integrase core domain protein n=2 Tax=Clostridium vincentii TaxID=52704 RepID=A0A2T0B2I8_9CLOT|nr:Integrase core domain protein [Clostridium vincentii]